MQVMHIAAIQEITGRLLPALKSLYVRLLDPTSSTVAISIFVVTSSQIALTATDLEPETCRKRWKRKSRSSTTSSRLGGPIHRMPHR